MIIMSVDGQFIPKMQHNPKHVYSKSTPNEFSWSYSLVSLHKIVVSIIPFFGKEDGLFHINAANV